MSATAVEQLLTRLRRDPTAVIELYPALLKISYWVLISPHSSDSLAEAQFLTYPCPDRIFELPAFTAADNPILIRLKRDTGAEVICFAAIPFLERMKDIVETGKTELAINPGTEHGIRINRAILLGLLAGSAGLMT